MSTEAIAGDVAQALEPAAAQLLEDLHSYISGEITRLEDEMPDRMDAAEQAVKYWVGDAKTVLHKFVAKIDELRGGASTVPPTQPSNSTPPPSIASPTPPVSPTSSPKPPTSSSSATTDAKPSA